MTPATTPNPGFFRRLWLRVLSAVDLVPAGGTPAASRWIPIRALAVRHKPRILKHLLALAPQDRYLRFGYPATDEQIERYVSGLNFVRDEIFGVWKPFDWRMLMRISPARLRAAGTSGTC